MNHQNRYVFLLRYILPIVDLLMLNLVYWIAVEVVVTYLHQPLIDSNNNHIIVCNLIWLFCVANFKMYNILGGRKLENIYRATWKSIALHMLLYISYLILHKKGHYSMPFIGWFYLLMILAFIVNRFVGTAMHYKIFQRYSAIRHVAVIGANLTATKLIDHFKQESNIRYFGSLGDDRIIYLNEEQLIEAGIDEKFSQAVEAGVSDLLITVTPAILLEVDAFLELADQHGLRVKFIPDLGLLHYSDFNVDYLGSKFPILSIRTEPLQEIDSRFKKRLFDLVFSGLVFLFILWWLLPIIAFFVIIDSKGPAFFFQNRNGRNNKIFKVIKFRTMRVVEKDVQFVQAKKGDARITKVGAFLRKTSLDEIPQFINVLLGEMTVVGPRPHPLSLNEQFNIIINKYKVRHFVKPGITGWAQVHGFRGETKDLVDMENRIKYDIYYLENWTAMFDVRIVFLTVINMIKGEDNAY